MKWLTGRELSTGPSWVSCTWFDREKVFELGWGGLQSLYKSGTASIQFAGIKLADDLTVYATFSVHPVGENFDAYRVCVKMEGDPS